MYIPVCCLFLLVLGFGSKLTLGAQLKGWTCIKLWGLQLQHTFWPCGLGLSCPIPQAKKPIPISPTEEAMYYLCKIVSVSFYGEMVKICNQFPLKDKYSVADSCKLQQI
jgi:hypothetical protein